MHNEKITVYLSDLTHTGPVISSNVHPLAVGLLGAQLLVMLPDLVSVELFKYPSDLSAAVARKRPRIAGFSNYSWNCNLAYEYAVRLKKHDPSTVIIFGGPNYGLSQEEIEDFWKRYPLIDFYIVREGEIAMVELVQALEKFNFDPVALKAAGLKPGNTHYAWNGEIVQGDLLPRIKELSVLPSPYLMGLMDKFFDEALSPMVHTTRGCPFSCTFCTEGAVYYSKVSQRTDLKAELEYIATRVGSVPDLCLSDANFGMFKEDKEKAAIIADVQRRYGWPKRIVASTGKNQKERVVEVAGMLGGALNIAASLQSTNQTVLDNIKRANISLDALNAIAQQTSETKTKADTYTEVILGLPGDSRECHANTLRDVIDADLGTIRMYQLILLPQTELNTPDTRRKYGMRTRHRIMPRSFGTYELLGEKFLAIESEEICVQTDSLSFEDYADSRELDLTVEILHNGSVFAELKGLCQWLGYSWFDFLLRFYQRRRSFNDKLTTLYDRFRAETTERLWESRDALEKSVRENMSMLQNTDGSTNEMANGKVAAFFHLQETLHDVLFEEMAATLKELGRDDKVLTLYVKELKAYSWFRKLDILDHRRKLKAAFHFDFDAIAELKYAANPADYLLPDVREYEFAHTDAQAEFIDGYVSQYGLSLDGLGRILMRTWPTKRLFRGVQVQPDTVAAHVS